MNFESYLIYIITVFIATILPGPSMVLALNHGIHHGIKRALITAGGNLVANLLMALVSIAGLGAIIIASGTAFLVLKWIGAGYLIYIGIKTWLAPDIPVIEAQPIKNFRFSKKNSTKKMFIEGFLVAAGNPKGIVFFTALFPQFINIKTASMSDFSLIFLPLALIAYGCFMLYAVCGQKITKSIKATSLGKILNRLIGGTFIGIGLTMVFKEK